MLGAVDLGAMPLAHPELFWSTARLAAALDDPGVRVVDCRAALGPDERARDIHATYLAGHLPGAVHCQWPLDLSQPPTAASPHFMLSDAPAFASTMARLGIGDGAMVVAYDNEGGHMAARLWLALRRYGHDRCAVLEGGLPAWEREGRPLATGEVTPRHVSFRPRPRAGVIASLADVREAVRSGDPWLLDVRRESEYLGGEARAKHGGHIPGAVHLEWRDAFGASWMLKDPDELERMYENAGIGAETATITYCQAGARAAFTHLVLTALGHDDVRTYDGSWEEYGNRDDVPIVKGRS